MKKIVLISFLFIILVSTFIFCQTANPVRFLSISTNVNSSVFTLNWYPPDNNIWGYSNVLYPFDSSLSNWINTGYNGSATLAVDNSVHQVGIGSMRIDWNVTSAWGNAGGYRVYAGTGEDWTNYQGVHFWLRGDGQSMNVYAYVYEDNDQNGSYDDVWYYQIPSGNGNTGWQEFNIPWSSFADPSWDTDVAANQTVPGVTNVKQVAIIIEDPSGGNSGSTWVDEFGHSPAPQIIVGTNTNFKGLKIIRKMNSKPTNVNDGVLLLNTTNTSLTNFDDTMAGYNDTYYYTIYTYYYSTTNTNYTGLATNEIVSGYVFNGGSDFVKYLTVSANPPGGFYQGTISVSLSLSISTNHVKIYYTLDGTEPTTNSILYTSPFTRSETTTVKFFAINDIPTKENDRTEIYTETYFIVKEFTEPIRVSPNVVDVATDETIRILINQAGAYTIKLFDVMGNAIKKWDTQSYQKGDYVSFSSQILGPNIYFVHIKSQSLDKIYKIIGMSK